MIAQTQSRPARFTGSGWVPFAPRRCGPAIPGMSGGTVAWTFGRDRIPTL